MSTKQNVQILARNKERKNIKQQKNKTMRAMRWETVANLDYKQMPLPSVRENWHNTGILQILGYPVS